MKKILIGIIILTVILSLGGGYYFFVHKQAPGAAVPGGAADFGTPGAAGPSVTGDNVVVAPTATTTYRSTNENQLVRDPIAGAKYFKETFGTGKNASSTEFIRYITAADGHVSEIALNTLESRPITNTTIPRLVEALWSNKKDVVVRYLNDAGIVKTYDIRVRDDAATTTTRDIVQGVFLEDSISSLVVSPKGDKIFYFVSTANGSDAFISNTDGSKKTRLFSLPLSELTASWPAADVVTLTTKPARGIPGYLYFVNPQTGSMRTVLSGINGLSALTNPSASLILYADDTLQLHLFSVKTGNETLISSIRTMPEKCVWSLKQKDTAFCGVPSNGFGGLFPDDWYQGTVSFTDRVYRIGTTTKQGTVPTSLVLAPYNKLDIINLMLSSDESALYFTNKHDGILWSFGLTN